MVLWVYKTYVWSVPAPVYWIELLMCLFYTFCYFVDQLRFQFNPGHVLKLNSIVDAFTVIPLLLQGGVPCGYACPESSWLTFSFIRAWRVLDAWQDIELSLQVLLYICMHCDMLLYALKRKVSGAFCAEPSGGVHARHYPVCGALHRGGDALLRRHVHGRDSG